MSDLQERKRDVESTLNAITDPCSVASGVPIGLVDMGIVESVEMQSDYSVKVTLLPTFPGCIYTAVFAHEIQAKLAELEWTSEIDIVVEAGGALWDEDRMSATARTRLHEARAARRRRARALRET
jgi:metal-sulfur cluster biosynthetic enzyme